MKVSKKQFAHDLPIVPEVFLTAYNNKIMFLQVSKQFDTCFFLSTHLLTIIQKENNSYLLEYFKVLFVARFIFFFGCKESCSNRILSLKNF